MTDNNPTWRKSSYSGNGNNDCVEVLMEPTRTMFRDSKDPAGGELGFSRTSLTAFLSVVRDEEA